jgi:hypothetical protein
MPGSARVGPRSVKIVWAGIALALALAAGVTTTSTAVVGAKAYDTTIGYSGPASDEPFYNIMFGTVDSQKRACLANRTVKLFLMKNGSLKLVDTDRTSRDGVWAAEAYAFVNGKVTVTSSKPSRTVKCRGDSLVLD